MSADWLLTWQSRWTTVVGKWNGEKLHFDLLLLCVQFYKDADAAEDANVEKYVGGGTVGMRPPR